VLKLLSEMEMCDENGEDLWEGMKEADEGGTDGKSEDWLEFLKG
jgi:hypothetical protein